MKLLPSVVLKLLLATVLSALVTGESLERIRRGVAAGTRKPDPPTGSTDQLLPSGDARSREVLDLDEANLDLFRVAFSSKPQAQATPSKEEYGKRKKKGKGLGKKRDPCLRKYKDFCIHGECRYVKKLRAPSCLQNLPDLAYSCVLPPVLCSQCRRQQEDTGLLVWGSMTSGCQPGYHGERCHGLTLPVENRLYSYDHTTILAVVAVVLSSVCLLVIVGLLMFRYHRRGGYNVENEEKVKLGMTNSH
ncbi:proheparin-binding EGF-like growth factor isoform X1 [Loxodonta africana]|uniref:proheparin-binding EGF-like growth factor isoform X1 n=1 Tax=Loxodonta africana TaxID=9785 RepID=UPI000C8122FD|nr:proheparin-binding EGF-like growth factor isoform X1 [Loxodonta africana]